MEGGDLSMSSVDDRIVAMKFENRAFEAGIGSTITSLGKLKSAMDMTSAGSAASKGLGAVQTVLSKFGLSNPFRTPQRGLEELQTSTGRFSFSSMEGGITGVSKSFLAMSTIAITALSNITTEVMRTGTQMAKSFTIDPVKMGLEEYESTLESTQTLMSGTGESVEKVTQTLKELNDYSDRTIYSFSDMTQNITAFTNAGMKSGPAAKVMMGIANAAASAGISSNQAAAAMRGFGQSMSMGFVGLQDWNQVDNAQLATKEFKEELIKSGIAVGTLKKQLDGTVTTAKGTEVNFKNLRSTLNEQWLTSEALTDTLARYSDTSTEVGKKAAANATRVKTLSQAMGILKESAQSGWSQTWQILFGNLEEASSLWTSFNDTIGGVIGRSADARNELLGDWKELNGRKILIDGIRYAWEALTQIGQAVKKAFQDVFPPMTAERLRDLTEGFTSLMQKLTPSGDTVMKVRRIFAGLFSVLSIGKTIFTGIIDGFQAIFGAMGAGEGNFLGFLASVGDFIVAIDTMLKQSGIVSAFFTGLGKVLAIPLKLLGAVAAAIGRLFTGVDGDTMSSFSNGLDKVGDRLSPLTRLADGVRKAFSKLGEIVGTALGGIGDAIAKAFTAQTFDKTLDVINTGLLAGILLMLKNFFSGGLLSVDFGGGVFDSVKETLGTLTDTLENMQAQIKADVLLKIAGALAILTASLVVLSMIDSKKLQQALLAMGAGFVALQAAMSAMVALINGFGAAKLPFIAAGMVGIATAMLILAGSLKLLSTIKPSELARGLAAMAAMMVILTKAVKPLSANSKGMITASVGLIAIATAMNIMAAALKSFAEMDYSTMVRGLAGVAGSLAVLAAGMAVMPKDIAMQAAAILILSGALKVMAGVVKAFGSMDFQVLGQGLLGVFSALTLIAGAMRLMPTNMVAQAVALNLVATAMHILQGAVAKFGNMTMEQIGKGLGTLAGGLLIIAGALNLMTGTLAGSAALAIATGALTVLAPILVTLGSMSWASIAKGLITLAGAFTIIGVAGVVLGPLVPVLLGLGAAMVLIGGAFALAGAGALGFASAFGIFVAAGSAGIAVISALLKVVITAIPKTVNAFAQGFIEMIKTIGRAAPQMVNSFSKIIGSILDAVIKNVPKMAQMFTTLITTALNTIVRLAPGIFNAGLNLIVGFLNAINNNIGRIVPLAVSIVTKFIDGVANNIGRIIQSGVNLIIKFVNGVADAIRNNSYQMGQAGGNLATAIVEGMVKGIAGGISAVTNAARDLAKSALNAAKDFLGIKSPSREFEKIGKFVDEGFAAGLTGGQDQVTGAMDDMATRLKDVATEAAADVEALKSKLKDLKNDKDPDNGAIKKVKEQIQKAKELEEASRKAHEQFMKGSKAERLAMVDHGKEYDRLTTKIKEQRDELQKLIDAREAEASSIASKYGDEPNLTHESTGEGDPERALTPEEYAAELMQKAAAVEQFQRDLATLRGMGMDDDTYRMLLEEGLDAQPFITQMLAGGAEMVQTIAHNTGVLNTAAATLGNSAASHMHDAGIQAQQGLITGLEQDQEALEVVMAKLARKMIRALRKALKIKSPSREFATIGKFSNEGLAKGLTDYASVAEKAAEGVGRKALDTLRVSMDRVSDVVPGGEGFNPVIAPVLDLTQLQKEATKIGGMLETGMTPSVSLGQASAISAISQAAKDAAAATVAAEPKEIKVESHLHSPTPISAADAFRNTKSALQLAKEALDKP